MARLEAVKPKTEEDIIPRWKKLLALPTTTKLWDISTGKIYTVEQFQPLLASEFNQKVEMFKVKFTDDTVYVPFLRLLEDKNRCSLQRGRQHD